ncbi:MAG TPA: hypothetical protein PKV67_03015 [Hyphomonas sp.]|nr:hypothetical protein [Hyphomonas sp.]HRI99718.1 hypothetical protein [Hyphomonas sp.]HRK66053.1 hypothetical protein [Hyphomonas sp.]
MRRIVWILAGALVLAQPGLALKDPPPAPPADNRSQDLSNEFDAFVQQALKEGLLSPVSPGGAKPAQKPAVEPGPADLRPAPVPEAAAAPAAVDCNDPYPLDFSNLAPVERYSDLYEIRNAIPEGSRDAFNPELTRAYIALDLAPEAANSVGRTSAGEGTALLNLARLIEHRESAPAAYFAELAKCHADAVFWHGLSLLAAGDATGAALMNDHLFVFRRLPLQLRDRVAFMAVPALDAIGDRTLAQKMLTTFTDAQIANSAQLTFSLAVLGLGAKDPAAEKVIEGFLLQSRFEEAALSSLVRHKRPVRQIVRSILLDEMVTRIEFAQKDADVRGNVRFVLDELSRDSMYAPLMKLAELPSMQSEAAHEELVRTIASTLERDLAGEDRLRNLAAIEALLNDKGLLDHAPQRETLYESATNAAIRLGFGTLAEALAAKSEGVAGLADQRALLAYRQKEYAAVFELAERHPQDQGVQLIAAKAAIDRAEAARIATYEKRLKLDPDTLLTLIEHDAAGARWMLSESTYRSARALTGEAQKVRVARVMRLKPSIWPEYEEPSRLPVASIPGKLNQSRQAIEQLKAEAAP